MRPYAVELFAAILICVAVLMSAGIGKTTAWVFTRKSDLTAISVGAAAISGVIFAAYFAMLCTEFGKKLRLAKAASEYTVAFAFPLLIFVTATILLIAVSRGTDVLLLMAATFMLVYSLLNCYTMVKNVIDLVATWEAVDRAHHSGRP